MYWRNVWIAGVQLIQWKGDDLRHGSDLFFYYYFLPVLLFLHFYGSLYYFRKNFFQGCWESVDILAVKVLLLLLWLLYRKYRRIPHFRCHQKDCRSILRDVLKYDCNCYSCKKGWMGYVPLWEGLNLWEVRFCKRWQGYLIIFLTLWGWTIHFCSNDCRCWCNWYFVVLTRGTSYYLFHWTSINL